MGEYLLDAHAAIWYFTGDALLSPTAGRIINDRANRIFLSVISAWEVAIKIGIGKLRFPGNATNFIGSAQAYDITIVPIKTDHLTTLEELPLFHRDPFDRLLVATAISEKMSFISVDKNIAQYNVPLIW
jgi:PIN domain nuclease of toxin-antitoxin system